MADEIKEFCHHYVNCWGLLKPDDASAEMPAQLLGQHDRTTVQMIFLKPTRPSYRENPVVVKYDYVKKNIKWYLPKNRFFNGRETCGYFTFKPIRQWSRGLYSEMGAIYMLHGNLSYTPRFNPQTDLAWNWDKPYMTFQEALKSIMEGERAGAAFTDNLAITAYKGFDWPILYHKTSPIGKMRDEKTVEIVKGVMMFKEQIEEKTGITVEKMQV